MIRDESGEWVLGEWDGEGFELLPLLPRDRIRVEGIVDGPSMTRDDLVQALMSHRDNDVHVYVPLESGGFVTLKIASVRYHSLSDMIHIETETHLDRELECE